jgi:hypothetical protein
MKKQGATQRVPGREQGAESHAEGTRQEAGTQTSFSALPAPCSRLVRVVEGLLALFAAWTIAYDIVVLLSWPCYFIVVVALPLAAVALTVGAIARSHPEGTRHEAGRRMSYSLLLAPCSLLVIGAAVALFTLLVNRPDSDDVAYMRRAVVQAADLRSPVVVSNVTYDANVPDVVPTQYLASYEMLIALTSRILNCDLLTLYFNVFPAGIAFLVPWVYYLLYREWDLDSGAASLAVLGAMLFLVFDGNSHWSPGNFAFARIWQGKCVLITLVLPLVLLVSWRFLQRPAAATWYPVFLSGICSVGLSASGLFVMPGMVLATSLAYVLAGQTAAHEPLAIRCCNALHLVLAAIYPIAVSLVLVSGIFPVAREVALVDSGTNWLDYLCGFGAPASLAWYAALLLVGPWLMLAAPAARILTWLPIVALALFFTPITGPFLARTLATTYFRLGYILPVAAAAGLAFSALGELSTGISAMWVATQRVPGSRLRAAAGVAALALLGGLCVMQAQQFTFSRGNHPCAKEAVAWKRPLGDRFPPSVARFARAAAPKLDRAIVLAPWEAAVSLALLNPHARFAITRSGYTRWSFSVKEQGPEWQLRDRAQALVAGPSPVDGGPEALRDLALRDLAAGGIDAVVVAPDADFSAVQAILTASRRPWTCAAEVDGYRLLLR